MAKHDGKQETPKPLGAFGGKLQTVTRQGQKLPTTAVDESANGASTATSVEVSPEAYEESVPTPAATHANGSTPPATAGTSKKERRALTIKDMQSKFDYLARATRRQTMENLVAFDLLESEVEESARTNFAKILENLGTFAGDGKNNLGDNFSGTYDFLDPSYSPALVAEMFSDEGWPMTYEQVGLPTGETGRERYPIRVSIPFGKAKTSGG